MRYFYVLSMCVLFTVSSCKGNKKHVSASHTTSPKPKGNAQTSPQSNQKAEKVISIARSYIGTPYKFGGTTKAGMDCSGLVVQAFKEIGITLPRTSEEQSKSGKGVALSDLRPGDLVFFTDQKGHTKVTHVGIVTVVKGPKDVKFIHASTKLGVVENDLYVSYYESILLKAVRVL